MVSDATYRYELSSNSRAVCQNSACKKEGVKIQKGEFRFGTLVDFQGHQSWRWKHWGCVTPLQIGNILGQLGGLDGLDLDSDLGLLDGYDDLAPEAQEKVKQALRDGHVADEDWKGEPELNRPGKKGINKRTPKKKAKEEDDDDEDDVETPVKKKPAAKKRKAAADDDDAEAEDKPKRKPRAKKAKVEQDDEDDDDEILAAKPKRKPRAKKTAKLEESEEDTVEEKPKPRNRAKKAAKVKDPEDEVVEKPKAKSRAKKVKAEDEENADMLKSAPPKKRVPKTKKVKDETSDELAGPGLGSGIGMPAAEVENKPAKKKGGRAKKVKVEEQEPEEDEALDPLAQLDGAADDGDVAEEKTKGTKTGKKKSAAGGKAKKAKAK